MALGIAPRKWSHGESSVRTKTARNYRQSSCSCSLSTYPIGVLASDDGKVLGHGSRFILYLQAICTWKDPTEKDEKDSQRAINAEQCSRTVGLRELSNVWDVMAHAYRP